MSCYVAHAELNRRNYLCKAKTVRINGALLLLSVAAGFGKLNLGIMVLLVMNAMRLLLKHGTKHREQHNTANKGRYNL